MNSFDYVACIVITAIIFLAKLTEVSLATVRNILIYKGMKRIVPVLAFIEVTIWLLTITQEMKNLDNFACVIAWSGGFVAGTYAGIWIEDKLALGHQLVRVITQNLESGTESLIERIRARGFGVTQLDAAG